MLHASCNFHRMSTVAGVLTKSKALRSNFPMLTRYKSENMIVTIGDVSKQVKLPQKPEYVPCKYLKNKSDQEGDASTLKHLKWILQKDILSQDIFLIGGPGTRRRKLALAYLELTEREVEFIALSRDTTESDLKQRREIESGTAYYHDQAAVRAATKGRILIIEGVEKAERNVLPVLNNLLENREMHLEDGRFLVPAARYDKLLENHSQDELDNWRLVRVSEDFRVIALGMPAPKYPGHPLDPPFRSRFQARHISPATFQTFMMDRKIERKQHCRRTVKDSDLFVDKRVFKNDTFERTSESDFKCRQTEGIPDTFWNPLFERVLQWLDLSGRAQSCDFEDEFARRSRRDAEQKSSSAKKTLPRIKHDSFEERDWLIRQNYKLYKERSSDFKPEESNICEDRLPKIKNAKEQFQERNKTFVEPLPSTLNDTKAFLKLNEDEDEVREKAPLMMWSSPGRLKLHIVIPNIVCKENQTSKD